jgi:bifunctional UDP-N-acetylglucosamine pyrophosphorylase/glucosamine-1-phosphate N-acetyltransferase
VVKNSARVAALILAAGKGTRMRSERAKVLAPLGGRPMIVRVLATVRAALRLACPRSPAEVVAVVGYDREAVLAALGPGVRSCVQPEQRGTGDAVRVAEPLLGQFDGWLLVLPGDMPFLRAETLARLVAAARAAGEQGSAGALLTCAVGAESRFGRVLLDAAGRAARIVEYRDAAPAERRIGEGNTGVYCLAAGPLFRALGQVGDLNAQREYYLTDVVGVLAREGRALAVVRVADAAEARSVDTPESLAAAEGSSQ